LCNQGDAVIAAYKASRIVLRVFTDHEFGRHLAVAINDDSVQSSATTNLCAWQYDTEFNDGIGVYANAREQ
jgi:hypothetical protein